MAASDDVGVRRAAWEALGYVAGPAALPDALKRLLEDKEAAFAHSYVEYALKRIRR
ncbi:MAG: hypothetical protein ACYTGN_19230 [Planctomycetota bacterium]|jgi:HEAT repeat protein